MGERGRGLARLWRWLWSDTPAALARCPVCGRQVEAMPNAMPSTFGAFYRIPRPVGELVGACATQHGSRHSAAEIAAARAERPWR